MSMRFEFKERRCPSPAIVTLLVLVLLPAAALADSITFQDPEGDDDGPGTYTYPTDRAYNRGDFDMTGVEIEYDDDLKGLVLEKIENIRGLEKSGDVHRNHKRVGKCINCSRRDVCPEKLE